MYVYDDWVGLDDYQAFTLTSALYPHKGADELGFSISDVVIRNQEKLESRKQRGTIRGNGDGR